MSPSRDREARATCRRAAVRQRRIDRGERLVAEQQTRTADQRAGDADALALAAGELRGAPGGEVEQADARRARPRRAGAPRGPWQRRQRMTGIGEAEQHVVDRRQPADQRVILEDRRGEMPRGAQRRRIVEPADVREGHMPVAGRDQSVEHAQQCGLADARRADDRGHPRARETRRRRRAARHGCRGGPRRDRSGSDRRSSGRRDT